MVPALTEGFLDHITSIGSYYIAAAGLLLTLAALIATGLGFYFSMKHAAALKSVEVDQKRFENVLECMRIAAGVKDKYPDGTNSTFMQIMAIDSLRLYPEHLELYQYMRDWYSSLDLTNGANRELHAASVRLVRNAERSKTLPKRKR